MGLSELEHLEFNNSRLTAAGLAKIRAAYPRLRHAELSGAKLDDAAVQEIGGMKELESLFLDNTGLTEARIDDLAKLPKLHWLSTGRDTLDEACFRALGRMPKLKRLSLLDVSIKPSWLAHLEPLSLESLDLDACAEVDDSFVPALARFKTLKQLNVARTKFTADGVKKLAAALPNCGIGWKGGVIEPAKK